MEEEEAFVSSSFLVGKVIEYRLEKANEMRNGYATNWWNY